MTKPYGSFLSPALWAINEEAGPSRPSSRTSSRIRRARSPENSAAGRPPRASRGATRGLGRPRKGGGGSPQTAPGRPGGPMDEPSGAPGRGDLGRARPRRIPPILAERSQRPQEVRNESLRARQRGNLRVEHQVAARIRLAGDRNEKFEEFRTRTDNPAHVQSLVAKTSLAPTGFPALSPNSESWSVMPSRRSTSAESSGPSPRTQKFSPSRLAPGRYYWRLLTPLCPSIAIADAVVRCVRTRPEASQGKPPLFSADPAGFTPAASG